MDFTAADNIISSQIIRITDETIGQDVWLSPCGNRLNNFLNAAHTFMRLLKVQWRKDAAASYWGLFVVFVNFRSSENEKDTRVPCFVKIAEKRIEVNWMYW